jgi:predicted membrane protein
VILYKKWRRKMSEIKLKSIEIRKLQQRILVSYIVHFFIFILIIFLILKWFNWKLIAILFLAIGNNNLQMKIKKHHENLKDLEALKK